MYLVIKITGEYENTQYEALLFSTREKAEKYCIRCKKNHYIVKIIEIDVDKGDNPDYFEDGEYFN